MEKTLSHVVNEKIRLIRGHKVMLGTELAELYQVDSKVLNQAVRRNINRFPDDFMFQLTAEECAMHGLYVLVESGSGRHLKYRPYAFTEQGVAMLSSVLKSERAIEVNIEIMRAFVRMKRVIEEHKDLAAKLAGLEKKYDAQFRVVFDAIRKLMEPVPSKRRRIGLHR